MDRTEQANRIHALTASRYLNEILSSVLGHNMAQAIRVELDPSALPLYRDARQVRLTLTLDEVQKMTDHLNRESRETSPARGSRLALNMARIAAFVSADETFEGVMAVLQPCEEMGGPTEAQYVALMERIAHETQRRANVVRERMAADADGIDLDADGYDASEREYDPDEDRTP